MNARSNKALEPTAQFKQAPRAQRREGRRGQLLSDANAA